MSRAPAVVIGIALCALAQASDIYRWKDETGRTYFGDSVPEKYRNSATKIEPRQPAPTQEQQRQAAERAEQERAALERARAATAPGERARASGSPTAQPAGAAQGGSADAIDCEIEHRLYRQSIDCFSRFMTQSGAVRAEAYQYCREIKDPSLRCGPPKPEPSDRTYANPRSERTY